ncbi:Protein phosphatase 2C family protein [Cryptosporidium meleagridis]|uniref:Protein phosphatase 2C family protein n=1 Tax=Cryptosporidium meleagridis TaxID=93969 RepID=A0A2P4YY04_9CRYT|nr:Protein phosphatase 2C family protein [Cryptosporidium meleagridis]
MNSTSLPLRAPASSILTRPGYVMRYPRSFKEQETFTNGGVNSQVSMHLPSENSHLNFDFTRGMRTLSAPSMSTPLNAFQTTNTHFNQPDRFGFATKSMTSSLNTSAAPQRLSSFSQMPYSGFNPQLHSEHSFSSINTHPGFIRSGNNPGLQGIVRNNVFQNQAQYPIQPQVMPPQYMMQQHAFQFQSQQSQFKAANERHMGFSGNQAAFTSMNQNQYSNSKQIPLNPVDPRAFDRNIVRLNTFSPGVQPQVMYPNSFQSNVGVQIPHRNHEFPQNFSPEVRGNGQFLAGKHLPTLNLSPPVSGGVTIKGYKPTVVTENQDKTLIIDLGQNASAYAVFDGHGPHGDVIAEFVSNKFTSSITQLLSSYVGSHSNNIAPPTRQQIKNFFIVLFHNMDLQLSELRYGISMWSGCTAAICVRIFNEAHIAWVGDSRVVIYKFTKPTYKGLDSPDKDSSTDSCEPSISWWTTSDHVPNRPDELSRITDCGASITVYSTPWLNKSTTRIREHGIAMSRSFGDKAGSQFGVICKPDMASIKLESDNNSCESEDKWAIVVASDGIWDSISEEEVGYKIMKNLIWREPESPEDDFLSNNQRPTQEEVTELANSLSSEAWKFRVSVENYSDDTTLIISII